MPWQPSALTHTYREEDKVLLVLSKTVFHPVLTKQKGCTWRICAAQWSAEMCQSVELVLLHDISPESACWSIIQSCLYALMLIVYTPLCSTAHKATRQQLLQQVLAQWNIQFFQVAILLIYCRPYVPRSPSFLHLHSLPSATVIHSTHMQQVICHLHICWESMYRIPHHDQFEGWWKGVLYISKV